MENAEIKKTRASTSEAARMYRLAGHHDALNFAKSIGLDNDYRNDPKAKKDVIDPSGDSHSVKSGNKKWQIFLYGLNRFQQDELFRVMNGMGKLLEDCIESFPVEYEDYLKDKQKYKTKLQVPMRILAEKLQDKTRLKAFLSKAMFNAGEVNYLTVCDKKKYYVFWGEEVAQVMSDALEIINSKARLLGQMDDQKVLFRYQGRNLAELEMRNDSKFHYREIRFNMLKRRAMALLFDKIFEYKVFNPSVLVYGKARNHFGRWRK